jgi:alkylation response protein AidB-like acyl-CoA dehydrogenase
MLRDMKSERMTAEERSLEVAEAAREQVWAGHSVLRDIFLGDFRLSLVHPFPIEEPDRPAFREFHERFRTFLEEECDPREIDRRGEYPQQVLDGLRALGAFGMKIPREYGGLGLNQKEYGRIMELLGSHDGNLTALLSAHQSIGVPQPVALFGTEEQKRAFLPRCARGAISAFALTEPAVGSDPASLATTAELSEDGTHYILDGRKLWCTNGTLAELLVVMARNPRDNRISAFVVETSWEGVRVEHRCRFMGLKALANAELSFTGVRVPVENRIGAEGQGLKIALTTLNAGRLSIPAAVVGASKKALEICRKWSSVRVQWGQPIGQHEAIAARLADMAAVTFAMESVSDLVSEMATRKKVDIRLEAAMAKEWNTSRAWELIDSALQIRGGRGYETEDSLEARGEVPIGIERMMRDSRINLIFEGSSEIMHLFMAREAVDRHLQVAGPLVFGKAGVGEKLAALPRIAAFYATWYPTRWLGWGRWPRYAEFGDLARHLRFVERASRRLARATFHGMLVHRAGLQKKEAFLFRVVDAGMELFAMAAVVSRVHALRASGHPVAEEAAELARLFCRTRTRKVNSLLRDLFDNDDALRYRVGRRVLEGRETWLEDGAIPLGVPAEALRPAEPGHRETSGEEPRLPATRPAAMRH